MNNRTRPATLTISLERDGQQQYTTIATRAIGEWHLHPYMPLIPVLDGEDKYWTISHSCGLAVVRGVARERARRLLYRLAALPPCPVPTDVAMQMFSMSHLATPEFREWQQAVVREVDDWRAGYSRRWYKR